ncbi:transposable element Tc3 transposase [Trichonephila clavipes]|uniref:Transposable element Tc3 transposase n=1 Tax=Trichonephila clavipes TaxID=2585209 RepID=A0A8X6WKA7_TRICX|nr:transposable element Tc3 transposase [Trichonephila clavipes]
MMTRFVTSVQEESVPVDDETIEDEDNSNNESSKGPSNANTFSMLETAMEWYEQQSECCPTRLLLLKRIRDLTSKHQRCTMELWFQPDGATCHTARATIDLLKDTFGDRLISRFGPVNWPPRSCDLTPLDYFLWGYVKSLVYADKPQALDHLEDNIRRVIADIRSQMLEKVIENWTSRLDYIRASRGSPMPEIIFKM